MSLVHGNSQGFYWMLADISQTSEKPLKDFQHWADGGSSTLSEVFQSSEYIVMGERCKLLAIHKSYLIWFEESCDRLSSPKHPGILGLDTPRTSQPGRSNIITKGFYSIKGAFVETSEGPSNGENYLLAPSYSIMQPTPGSHKERSGFDRSRPKQPKSRDYFLRIWKHRGSKISETLYFDSRPKYEEWRAKLAASSLFFGDLHARYRIAYESDSQLKLAQSPASRLRVRVENVHTNESLTGWRYGIKDLNDKKTVNAQAFSLLQECGMMVRLKSAAIVPEFRELSFTDECFMLIQETTDAVPFSEWFSNTWCPEYGDHKDPGPVLSLMIDLTALVVSLSIHQIAHGNICKDTVMVRPICKTPASRSPTLQSTSRRTRPLRGAAMEQSEYLRTLKLSKKKSQSEHSLAHSPEGSIELHSIMKSRQTLGYTLTLSDLSGAVDCKAGKMIGPSLGSGESASLFEVDVIALGKLLAEVFYAGRWALFIDDPTRQTQTFGQFVDQQKRHSMVSQVVSLLTRMTSLSGSIPSVKECYDCLVVARATLSKEAKAAGASGAPSRLSLETLKLAFPIDATSKIVAFERPLARIPKVDEPKLSNPFSRKVSFNLRRNHVGDRITEARHISESEPPKDEVFFRPSLTLRLPSPRALCSLKHVSSWQSSYLRNASTIDKKSSQCDGSDLNANKSQSGKGRFGDGSALTLRHYRSYSASPRVCLSGREQFAKENKLKQVVPGTGDSVQTITSKSHSKLRLKPEVGKYSLLAANNNTNFIKKNQFFSFRDIGRKSSCPTSDIRVEEPWFAHSVESSSQSSNRTLHLRPAFGWPTPLLKFGMDNSMKRDQTQGPYFD